MATLTLVISILDVTAIGAALLGVCVSIFRNVVIHLLNITRVVVSKESIPVVCLIQLAEILMSVLGYIVMAIPVSLLCTSRLVQF